MPLPKFDLLIEPKAAESVGSCAKLKDVLMHISLFLILSLSQVQEHSTDVL